jgi:hypothetical protein
MTEEQPRLDLDGADLFGADLRGTARETGAPEAKGCE